MADQKYWTPTRGYLSDAGSGAADPDAAPAAASPSAASTTSPSTSAAGAPGCWTPTRGYLVGAVQPAADAGSAPESAAARKANVGKAAAATPTPRSDAEPSSDPARDSITTVDRLADHRVFRDIGKAIYDEPDSETTLYRIPTLNVLFAVTSALLLLSLAVVFWQDYDRQWKHIQKDWIAELRKDYSAERDEHAEASLDGLAGVSDELDAVLRKLDSDAAAATIADLPAKPTLGSEVTGRAATQSFRQVSRRIEAAIAAARDRLDRDEKYESLAAAAAAKAHESSEADRKSRETRGEYQAKRFVFEEEKRQLFQGGQTTAAKRQVDRLTEAFNKKWDVVLDGYDRAKEEAKAAADSANATFASYVEERTSVPRKGGTSTDLAALESRYGALRRPIDIVQDRLDLIEVNWRNGLRNAPLLDALAPTYRIEKVITPQIKEPLNFLDVERIHRCKTCHINIDSSAPEVVDWHSDGWGTVYQSHPRLDLFLSTASPHPYDDFGCTTCHYGDGHALEFGLVAHTPTDETQKREWEEKYHWHEPHHQDFPMLPKQYSASSCTKCHSDEVAVEGAGKLNRGKELVRAYGCFGCHKIDGFEITQGDTLDDVWKLEKVGPNLAHIGDKVTRDFLQRWIRKPGHFRESTRMPQFFDLTNNRGTMKLNVPDSENAPRTEIDFHARNGIEVLGLTTYLLDTSRSVSDVVVPDAVGDATRGRELIKQVGCLGCHSIKIETESTESDAPTLAEVRASLEKAGAAVAKSGVVGAKLDLAYREVETALEMQFEWLDALWIGQDIELLYHRVSNAIETAERLEESLGEVDENAEIDSAALGGAAKLARLVYDRWVHSTFASDLSSVARKFDLRTEAGRTQATRWMATWIVSPERHDPATVMPSFRFEQEVDGEQKVADMVAYLLALDYNEIDYVATPAVRPSALDDAARQARNASWAEGVATLDKKAIQDDLALRTLLDEMTFDLLRATHTAREAKEQLPEMSIDHKLRFVGHRMVRRYGCFGCHDGIADDDPGPKALAKRAETLAAGGALVAKTFDDAPSIGPELNRWGHKDPARLDFGLWGHQPGGSEAIPHRRYDWLTKKLERTRRYDVLPVERVKSDGTPEWKVSKRLMHKKPDELLIMPLFPFRDDEEQIEAITTFVLSLVDDPIAPEKKKTLDDRERVLEAGGRLVRKLNCAGCHRLGASTEYVHIDDLPDASQVGDEAARLRTIESETWTARAERWIAKPVGDPLDQEAGITVPGGFPLMNRVHQERTGDGNLDAKSTEVFSAYEEPVGVTELVRRHYDPLPAFIQDVARALEAISNEDEGEDDLSFQPYRQKLQAFLDSQAKEPDAEFTKRINRSFLGDTEDEEELWVGEYLVEMLEDPYGQDLDLWQARGLRGTARLAEGFRSLAKVMGVRIVPRPYEERTLAVEGYNEGGVRFYFGTDATTRYRAAPPLLRQGDRVKSEWLFDFLLDVRQVRPWLKLRMPSYRLSDDEARLLVEWFKAKSGVPFAAERSPEDRLDAELAGLGKALFGKGQVVVSYHDATGGGTQTVTADSKQCNQCHPRGTDYPTKPMLDPADAFASEEIPATAPDDSHWIVFRRGEGVEVVAGFESVEAAKAEAERRFSGSGTVWAVGKPWDKSAWGPDLQLAAGRLRPQWMREWIYYPPDFMPGTKMPSFFARERFTGDRAAHVGAADKVVVDALLRYLVHMNRPEVANATSGGDATAGE